MMPRPITATDSGQSCWPATLNYQLPGPTPRWQVRIILALPRGPREGTVLRLRRIRGPLPETFGRFAPSSFDPPARGGLRRVLLRRHSGDVSLASPWQRTPNPPLAGGSKAARAEPAQLSGRGP